jgi:hypothetical protein
MPSAFDTLFADGRRAIFDLHAVSVTWTKADGETVVSTSAVIGQESLQQVETDTGTSLRRSMTVELLEGDVPDPNRGDVLAVAGVDWTFHALDGRGGGVVAVTVLRPEQAEITHRGYRGT